VSDLPPGGREPVGPVDPEDPDETRTARGVRRRPSPDTQTDAHTDAGTRAGGDASDGARAVVPVPGAVWEHRVYPAAPVRVVRAAPPARATQDPVDGVALDEAGKRAARRRALGAALLVAAAALVGIVAIAAVVLLLIRV